MRFLIFFNFFLFYSKNKPSKEIVLYPPSPWWRFFVNIWHTLRNRLKPPCFTANFIAVIILTSSILILFLGLLFIFFKLSSTARKLPVPWIFLLQILTASIFFLKSSNWVWTPAETVHYCPQKSPMPSSTGNSWHFLSCFCKSVFP